MERKSVACRRSGSGSHSCFSYIVHSSLELLRSSPAELFRAHLARGQGVPEVTRNPRSSDRMNAASGSDVSETISAMSSSCGSGLRTSPARAILGERHVVRRDLLEQVELPGVEVGAGVRPVDRSAGVLKAPIVSGRSASGVIDPGSSPLTSHEHRRQRGLRRRQVRVGEVFQTPRSVYRARAPPSGTRRNTPWAAGCACDAGR